MRAFQGASVALLSRREETRLRLADLAVERITRPVAAQGLLAELAAMTRHETLALLGPDTSFDLETKRALDEVVSHRGAVVRTVCVDSVRDDTGSKEYARWLAGIGGELRSIPSVPVEMLVLDRHVAVLPGNSGNPAWGVLVRDREVVAALRVLFETVWADAAPVAEPTRPDRNGLTPQQREVLRLLGNGLTDDAVARRLGVSGRTIRRLMSEMMARLDAKSRFQAGQRVAELGWLDS